MEWYHKKRYKAIRSQYPKVKKYAEENRINMESSTNKCIKRWIYGLKKLKKNAKKHKDRENIRGYFQ